MEQRNDYLAASQSILEFQLAMLRLAGQGAQRMFELGLAATAPPTSDSPAATRKLAGSQEALSVTASLASATSRRAASYGSEFSDLRLANRSQLASANREYVERMQQNVDSMLHALAMAPVAADRFIRAAAAASERPSNAAASPASERPAPSKRRKAQRSPRADHAE